MLDEKFHSRMIRAEKKAKADGALSFSLSFKLSLRVYHSLLLSLTHTHSRFLTKFLRSGFEIQTCSSKVLVKSKKKAARRPTYFIPHAGPSALVLQKKLWIRLVASI